MHIVLEFPPKVFVQWGAIAQEVVPYLAQRGVKRDEIGAVLARLKSRWEQPEEGNLHVSRHWKSQSARMLIESAMADYQRHLRR